MEVKPGYKQTEVGFIPEEWEVKPLKRISPKQSVGLVINPSTYFDKAGTVPLLVGSNVAENFIDATTSNQITKFSNSLLSASRLAAGDLVTVRVGEPGVTAVVPPELDGCNCASMMIVRRNSSFDSHWLCAVMNSRVGRRQVEHVQYGTAQKQFNISDAVDFCFAVPSLPEQRAIAEALGDVDALQGGLDRLIAKKRDLKQVAMQQLLTGQTRLPGFHSEWEDRPLTSDVANLEAGVSVNSVEGELDADSFGFAVLKTSAVENGAFLPWECKRIAARDVGRVKLTPRANSILVSRMNTIDLVGECGYVAEDYPRLFIPDRLWMTRFKPDSRVSAKWLSCVLSSSHYRQKLRGIATGTSGSMKNISKGAFLALQLSFPRLDEQTAIASVLTEMDAELAALEKRREKTRALRQAMMQELLTGRTRLWK